MGAHFLTMTVESTDKETVRKEFRARQAEDEYEYGHNPYNGSFSTMDGIEFVAQTFTNEDDASDYLLTHSEKWGNALAVTVKEDNREPFTLIGGRAAC